MGQPYAVYQNPYTGYFYATDAGSFAAAGQLYQWNADGVLQGKHKVYINPGHMLALPPDGQQYSGIEVIKSVYISNANVLYDLHGRRIKSISEGHIYIQEGRKFIYEKSK